MSERTNKLKKRVGLFHFFSFVCNFVPLLIYLIIGFSSGDIHKGQKIFLSFTFIMAIILLIINLIMKYHLRSPIFIILMGIYYALNNILTLMILVSIGIIIDEFIIQPCLKKWKTQLIVNKEIDNRL